MGDNSIRNNLSKDDIISDIILSMGADINHRNVYILVEGEDDISLIHPYITDNVMVYESYDGKNGVEFIVGERFADNERVIGIRDTDYQIGPLSDKIFYYDYGCMEMMLIANDEIFDNLCFEYYRGTTKSKLLKKEILNQLKFLSIVRMFNEREQWGIILRGISLNQAMEAERFEINNEIIIHKINKMNNNFINDQVLSKLNEAYACDWSDENFLFNTQGHDFFVLFTAICNRYKKRGIKYTDVEASARCVFRWSDLIKTNLYSQLNSYSNTKNLKILHAVI